MAERDTAWAMSQENLDLFRRVFEYVERTGEVLPEAVHAVSSTAAGTSPAATGIRDSA
jgi:hypothetical protein